jgi:glycosyltransferase involved in cell wall biosynthesis
VTEIPAQPVRRILYVERTTWLGGSTASLDGLLKGLDSKSYQPLILTRHSNALRHKWEKLGEVILEETGSSGPLRRDGRDIAGVLKRVSPTTGRLYLGLRDFLTFVGRDRVAARRLKPLLVDRKIDLIHNNNGLPFDRATVTAGWLAGVSQVCHFRAFTPLSPIDRWLARRVQSHICVSEAVKQYLVRQGIPDRNLHVVYNPIDLDAFSTPGDVAKTRKDLGLRSSDLVVTNVARLDWWKGQDVFLKAIAELKTRWPDIRALLVGDCGPTRRSVDYCEQLRRTVAQLGLQETVVFAGVRLDIPSVMAASDVLVHSSTQPEPLGRVIMEGMAAGRPVIATAAGGVNEIVKDGETGMLIPLGSSDAIVDTVELLLREPLFRNRISQKAQAYAREHFSVYSHWDSVRKIYQLVAELPPERVGKQGILR